MDGGSDNAFTEATIRIKQLENEMQETGIRSCSIDGKPRFDYRDFSVATSLRKDHEDRPLWICPNGTIFLDGGSKNMKMAETLMQDIAEPRSRPEHIHEYVLTANSLYSAVCVGHNREEILKGLSRLSKEPLPDLVKKFIISCTEGFGKAKMVLSGGQYYVQSTVRILKNLRQHPVIQAAEQVGASGFKLRENVTSKAKAKALEKLHKQLDLVGGGSESEDELQAMTAPSTPVDPEEQMTQFAIRTDAVEDVRNQCRNLNYPLLEEYDFRHDHTSPKLDVRLRPTTSVRPHQEKALQNLFGVARARSGVIVLPCGAGKTLVGISATCTIQKSTLILCNVNAAVDQWISQFKAFSTISSQSLLRFQSHAKEDAALLDPEKPCVMFTTYSMMGRNDKQLAAETKVGIDAIRNITWGLMIFDEVHQLAARTFRQVIRRVRSHCKLGLTATLLREDDKIDDLNYLIGPKLYEANWLDLTNQGFLARVQCIEVWCPMTSEFLVSYMKETTKHGFSAKSVLHYNMNPTKLECANRLLEYHRRRGDKVLIFSQSKVAAKMYAHNLDDVRLVTGDTSRVERKQIFDMFRSDPDPPPICFTSVGDSAIDLPSANVLIQVSSLFSSQRNETQRLGRILRQKPGNLLRHLPNAFFYTLISTDTRDMYYSQKRQRFLQNQGYAFKILTAATLLEGHRLVFNSKRCRARLLQVCHSQKIGASDMSQKEEGDTRVAAPRQPTRIHTSSGAMAGGSGSIYHQINRDGAGRPRKRPRR